MWRRLATACYTQTSKNFRKTFGFSYKEFSMKILVLLIVLSLLTGCGAFSATTLRCGTDGESSYLELVSAPQQIGSMNRSIGEMCGFAYEQKSQ